MTFAILPAVDVTRGSLGVFTTGGPRRVEAFGGDPLAAAAAFVDAGARWLHFVDMDAAFGTGTNVPVLSALGERFGGVKIQASGGFTEWEQIEGYLAAGAARAVLGSAALDDESEVERILSRAGAGRLLVGLEVGEGRIRSRGSGRVDLDLMATLGWLDALHPPGYLLTDVGRVGGLGGPDLALLRRVARVGRPVLLAGGIRSLADLIDVREAGGSGAVVGRAALEGGIDLPEALAWAAGWPAD